MPEDKDIRDRKTTKADKYAGLIYHLTTWLAEDMASTQREEAQEMWAKLIRNYKGNLPDKNFPWQGACFSLDTEILTLSGWRFIADVKIGDSVYTRDNKEKADYRVVTNTLFQHADKMVHFRGKNIDLLVTPNHRMLIQSDEGILKFVKAEKFLEKQRSGDILLTSISSGAKPKTIHGIGAKAYLRFLGWYISEGWACYDRKNRTTSSFGISQSKVNQKNREIIKDDLHALGATFKECDRMFIVHARGLPESLKKELRGLGICYEKHIPPHLLQLDPSLLKNLLNTLLLGDGNIAPNGHRTYYTTSRQLADDVQVLAQKIGLKATIHVEQPCKGGNIKGRQISGKVVAYKVSIGTKKKIQVVKLQRKQVDYDGFVACVEVPPYHTLYVRRNGKPIWCGNSNVNTLVTMYMVDGVALRLKNFLVGDEFKADLKTSDKEAYDSLKVVEDFINPIMNVIIEIGKKINELTHRAAKIACITRLDWVTEELKKERYVEVIEQVPVSEIVAASPELQAQVSAIPPEGVPDELIPVPTMKPQEYTEKQEKAVLSFVSLADFLVPDDATCLDTANRKTQRMWLTLDYMKEKKFKNLDKVKSHIKEKKKGTALNEDEKNLIESGDISFGEEKAEVFETTTTYTVDGKKDKYLFYFHNESRSLLKIIEYRKVYGNAKSQFQRFVIKEDGTFWAMGVAEVCEKSHEIINSILNSILNMTALIIQGIVFYEKDAYEDDEKTPVNFKIYPGAKNEVKDVSKIKFMDFPGEPLIGWEAIEQLITMLERAIGLSAPMLAQPTEEKKTLGEVSLIKSEGDLRHSTFFASAGEAFKELIKTVLILYQKNMTPDMFSNLVDEKGDLIFDDTITRESIQGNFTPTVRGAVGLQLQAERQQLYLGMLELVGDPEEMKLSGNTRELLESIAENSNLDPEKVLLKAEEVFQKQVEIQKEAIRQLALERAEQEIKATGGDPSQVLANQGLPGGAAASPSPEIADILGRR